MQRFLLLGDSIRLSYRDAVGQRLNGAASVCGPDDNCRFVTYTLFYLRAWLGDGDYDVVQWNNGQWDVCRMPDGRNLVPLDEYVAMQMRIATILRGRARRLIFATTTPVHADMLEKATVNPRCNEDIMAYNAAAAEALSAMGVQILDLFTPLHEDVMKYIREDRVHLTPAGVDRCADLVAAGFANGA